jgi:hypothetical protein
MYHLHQWKIFKEYSIMYIRRIKLDVYIFNAWYTCMTMWATLYYFLPKWPCEILFIIFYLNDQSELQMRFLILGF